MDTVMTVRSTGRTFFMLVSLSINGHCHGCLNYLKISEIFEVRASTVTVSYCCSKWIGYHKTISWSVTVQNANLFSQCNLTAQIEPVIKCDILLVIVLSNHLCNQRRVWRYQRGNQNPYIEEQTTQQPNEKVKRTKNDLQNINIKLQIE